MTLAKTMQGISTRQYSKEIDIELMAFIERYATNLTRWDVLIYFGKNPDASENVDTLAGRVGRRPNVVVKELDDLTYLGILCTRQNGHGMQYELAPLREMRRTVARLAKHYGKTN